MKNERFVPQQATYTAKEAATYLKVSERQIRNFIKRKLLRKSKVQAKTLIPGEDVETLLARTT
jgi:excisionase family DNA binding protein